MDVGVLVTIRSLLPNLAPVERRVDVVPRPGSAVAGQAGRQSLRKYGHLGRHREMV